MAGSAGLVYCLVLVLPPVIVGLKAPECVFRQKANVSCKWEPGDSQTTHYTLSVQRMPWTESRFKTVRPGQTWLCDSTTTNCTITLTNLIVDYNFCVSVTAHSRHGNVTSEERCRKGIYDMELNPVELKSITSVSAKCLNVTYSDLVRREIDTSQIKAGQLKSQIQFRARGQKHARVSDVNVTDYSFVACVFSPDTLYSVRLRHRYQSSTGPWSQWSNEREGRTAEDAPSAAPMVWRRVLHQDKHRLTALLWKPVPPALANGKILFYTVICQDENAQTLQNTGKSGHLNNSDNVTSLELRLPVGPCSCSISASTSVGPSPVALIWFSSTEKEKEHPPPSRLSVTALNDTSLGLKWAPPSASGAVSGFMVEWFVVTEKNNSRLYWKQVNSSTTATVITEGVEKFQRYAVSVRAMYGRAGAGQNKTELAYTRQGVPSAGPKLNRDLSSSAVKISWNLPVENQRGFIQNYTLFYSMKDQPPESKVFSGSETHGSLSLSPGHYMFWMQASTEAGTSASGDPIYENIGPEEMSVFLYITVLLPIGLVSLLLIVTACVIQSKIVKWNREIPDPSHSSLKTMTRHSPTTFTQPAVQCSEVVLLSDRETRNYCSDLDTDLQTCSYPSTLTHYNPFRCDTKYQSSARTTNMVDTSYTSCPVIYPFSLVSNELASSSLEPQHHSYPNVKHYKQPQEGDSEQSRFKAQVDDGSFYQMQAPDVAFSSACVPSHLHSFNVGTPLLQPETFCQIEPQENTCDPHLPFLDPFILKLMTLSPSSVQCDPYLPV